MIKKYNIKPKDIHNFNKIGVYISYSKGVEVIILIDVNEVEG